jgi:hypothetical protein
VDFDDSPACGSSSPRIEMANAAPLRLIATNISPTRYGVLGGAEGIRTPDPLHAMQVRYQLRHSPDALICAGV